MMHSSDTVYNKVIYPSAVYPQTHPGRLAVIGGLFGLKCAPVERCRVLELGCGDGMNLITMAHSLPESRFLGIDLAEKPIAAGNELAAGLSLRNVELRVMDVLQATMEFGTFDYIIAHGLYSWVPADVREKIMHLCGRLLTEHGVAYISYNAYPGNHLRDMARGIMRFHAAHFDSADQQIRQSRAILKFASEAKEKPELYHKVLAQELERTLKYTDAGFYHDDLSSLNQPFYFHQVASHAAQHGLQYLGEADYFEMREDIYPENVLAILNQIGNQDVVTREQYVDFLRGRAFRQTLLCRQTAPLTRPATARPILEWRVASSAKRLSTNSSQDDTSPEDFENHRGMVITVSQPIIKRALSAAGSQWPKFVSVRELLNNRTDVRGDEPAESSLLCDFLLRAYALNFVELNAFSPNFTLEVSERPAASVLARAQLERGDFISTMRHEGLRVGDPMGKQLLLLLDGTRDRAMLLDELFQMAVAGSLKVVKEGNVEVRDPEEMRGALKEQLEFNLKSLARSAVLVA